MPSSASKSFQARIFSRSFLTPILFRFFARRLRHGYTEVFLSSDYLRDLFGKRAYWSRRNRLWEALRIPVLVTSFAFYLRFRLGFRTVSLDKSVRHFQFLLFSSNSSYNVELSGPAPRLMSPLLYLILHFAGRPPVSPGTLQFFVGRIIIYLYFLYRSFLDRLTRTS